MPSKEDRTPTEALSLVWSAISAACSSALVGMQPRCRQVPPTLFLFDQRHALAEFGRAQRAGVSAAATAEHDEVVAADALCHPSSLLSQP